MSKMPFLMLRLLLFREFLYFSQNVNMAATKSDVLCVRQIKIDFIKDRKVTCKGNCQKSFHKRCAKVSDIAYASYSNDKDELVV